MPATTLKTVRFFVGAFMLFFLLAGVCWYSGWCELAFPTEYDKAAKSIFALVLGYLYHISGLRELANKDYFSEVNNNLACLLTRPFANDPAVPQGLRWNQIRPIFYRFIDSDPSLKHQASLAFWNGAFWTTASDLRALSCLGATITAILMLFANIIGSTTFNNQRATYFFLLMIILFLISIVFSILTTRKHIEIGTQQCEYIVLHQRAALRDSLIAAAR